MAHNYNKQELAALVKKHNLRDIKLSGAGRTKEAIYNDLVREGVINDEDVKEEKNIKKKSELQEKPKLKVSGKPATKRPKKEETIYFYGHTGPHGFLSNFYPAIFQDEDEETFVSSEQYFMWRKAKIFDDEEIADKIIDEATLEDFTSISKDAKEWKNKMSKVKKLGRSVKGFDPVIWDNEREDAMLEGLRLKFNQNDELKDLLLSTGSKRLAEASPTDRIWGIGLTKAKAEEGEKWQGENLLGKLLETVREELHEKPKRKTTKRVVKTSSGQQKKPTLLDEVRKNKMDPSIFFPNRGKNRTYA